MFYAEALRAKLLEEVYNGVLGIKPERPAVTSSTTIT